MRGVVRMEMMRCQHRWCSPCTHGCCSWRRGTCWCRTLSFHYPVTRHHPPRLVDHCYARGRSPSRIDACN